MHNEGKSVHVSKEEARGGSKEGVVRWVLIFGTLLAIIALTVIWVTGAATSDDTPSQNYASEGDAAQAEETGSTDTLLPPGEMGAQREIVDGQPVVTNPEEPTEDAAQ